MTLAYSENWVVLPAKAGVIPFTVTNGKDGSSAPREGGGDPELKNAGITLGQCSPRRRG